MSIQRKLTSVFVAIAVAVGAAAAGLQTLIGNAGIENAELHARSIELSEKFRDLRTNALRIVVNTNAFLKLNNPGSGTGSGAEDVENPLSSDYTAATLLEIREAGAAYMAAAEQVVPPDTGSRVEESADLRDLRLAGEALVAESRVLIAAGKARVPSGELLERRRFFEEAEQNLLDTVARVLRHQRQLLRGPDSELVFGLLPQSVVIWLFGAVIMAFVLVLGAMATRGIVRPLRFLTKGFEELAEGDFTARIDVQAKDEIGRLAGLFNLFAEGRQSLERDRLVEIGKFKTAQEKDAAESAAQIENLRKLAEERARKLDESFEMISTLRDSREKEAVARAVQLEKALQDLTSLNSDIERRVDNRTVELYAAQLELVRNEHKLLTATIGEMVREIEAFHQEAEQRAAARTGELQGALKDIQNANENHDKRTETEALQIQESVKDLVTSNDSLEKRVEGRTQGLREALKDFAAMGEISGRRLEKPAPAETPAAIPIPEEEVVIEETEGPMDIAALKRELEERMAERTVELEDEQSEKIRSARLESLSQLASTISNELRIPIGGLRTSLFMIKSKTRGSELGIEEAIERAGRSVDHCDSIINEMLDFADQEEMEKEATAIDDWLDVIIEEQMDGVLEKPYTIEGVQVEREKSSPEFEAFFDNERLQRVVVNVFENGCHSMENNGPDQPRIMKVRTGLQNDRFEMRFTDVGIGMDEETLSNIFEPLYSRKSYGAGLGMSTVKQTMERHNGGVEVVSKLGEGTTVLLWLPVQQADGEEKAA